MSAQQLTKHYKKPWQLLVSVCLTRLNILRRQLTDIEERYAELLDEMEREQAVLNDYEYKTKLLQATAQKTHDTATSNTSKMKISEEDERQVMDAARQLSAIQDKEEMWAADLSKVRVAPKTSSNDTDQTTMHRCLEQWLHMVIDDENLLNEKTVVYPYSTLKPDENLRQASERIIANHGIHSNDVLYLSNAPVGVVKIRFNENEERGEMYQGAKIFFTKAQLTSNVSNTTVKNIEQSKTTTDVGNVPHKWLMLNELETDSHVDYFKRVRKFVN